MKKRIESINFLRIISMILVLLFHAKIYYGFSVKYLFIDRIIEIGAVAVTIFFVLSGYSLRQNYTALNINNKTEMKNYFIKRIIAIYPIYFVLLIISYVFVYNIGGTWQQILSLVPIQLSLLQVLFFPALCNYSFNNNFWYISALFVLYILFPYINEALNSIKKIRNKIILCVVLLVVSQYTYYLNIYFGNAYLQYYVSPIFRLPEFMIGILLADICKEEKCTKYFKGEYKILVAGILLVLSCNWAYSKYGININLYNIFIIPFVVICVLCMTSSNLLNKLGGTRLVKYISSLGLEIYLCQSLSIFTLQRIIFNIPNEKAFILLTIIYALVFHELIQKPTVKLLRKFLIKD